MKTQTDNFVFFGTPWIARDTLASLISSGFIPKTVVSSPDAPVGRGLVLTPSKTKVLALENDIAVLTPIMLDAETILEIKNKNCDYAIVVAYGKIFPSELIEIFPKGVLNVHYSLLPKYRGATPLESALLAGDVETGVTIQTMVREVDAGAILAQEKTEISPNETARELRPRLVSLGSQLLLTTLPKYLNNEITPIVQDASLASRAHKIKKEDGLLSLPAGRQDSTQQDLENWKKYRAYADSIGTYFFSAEGGSASGGEKKKRMKITRAEFVKGEFRVLRVIPEGKKEMEYCDKKFFS